MSKKDEALQLALEALVAAFQGKDKTGQVTDAITAIREALAQSRSDEEQPAQHQEPVAYASDVEFDDETEIIPAEQKGKLGTVGLRIPLYIDPPAQRKPWVGLTNEEMLAVVHYSQLDNARAIEAKLKKKKNAQPSKPLTQDMVESCPYHEETLRGAFFDGWIKAEAAYAKGDV